MLASCSSEPGHVGFRVLWPEDASPPAEVFLRSRVRLGGAAGVVQAEPVGPVPWGQATGLGIDEIPNGVGHVLVLEVAATRDAEVVLYFGESAPFDLAPGLDQTVTVPLSLRRPPSTGTATAAIALASGRSRVRSPRVVLALASDSAVSVELSNRASFVGAVRTVDLATAEGAGPGCPPAPGAEATALCSYRVPWDLDEDVDDPCVEQDSCPRVVFARFRDASGFRSGSVSASVILDTRTPSPFVTTIDPVTAAAESPLIVQVSLQEAVRARDVRLSATSTEARVERRYPAVGDDDTIGANFTFELRPRSGRWSGRVFALRLDAEDLAGNRTVPPIVLGVAPRFDVAPPRVSGLVVQPSLIASGVRSATVSFVLSEPIDDERLIVETSPVPSASGPDQGRLTIDPRTCRRGQAGLAYVCRLDLRRVDLTGLAGVELSLRVEATDAAGNAGASAAVLRVDTVPPAVIEPVAVLYLPAADNALPAPTAATVGTTIRVRLLFDEAVDTAVPPTEKTETSRRRSSS